MGKSTEEAKANTVVEFTKIDIEILNVLKSFDMISELKSYRIFDICDALDSKPSQLTVSRHIKDKLMPVGYVALGMRDSRAHTYYITQKGIEFLTSKLL